MTVQSSLLNRGGTVAGLSGWSIAARVVGAATPLTVVAGVVPNGTAATGGVSFPLIFLLIAGIFAVFAVGYLAAARLFPAADASATFYCLIRHGLGRMVGVGAGWVAMAAYTALTLGLYGLIGSTVTPLLDEAFSISVPWQIIALTSVAIVGWLGLVKITTSTRLLIVLVSLEIVIILAVSVANIAHPAAGGASFASLEPHRLLDSLPVTAACLTLGVLGFVGTELTVNHAADARTKRDVRRATYLVLGVLTLVYVLASFGMSATLGPDRLVAAATADPSAVFVGTAETNLGTIAAVAVRVLFATSVLAGAVAFHLATARYCHYLGKGRTAPALLGRESRRYGGPVTASLLQTGLAVIAIVAVTISDGDPVVVLFYLAGTAGAVGILTLLTLTAVSTTVLFLRNCPDHTARPDWPRRRGWIAAASVTASVLLGALIVAVLIDLDTLLNVGPDSALPVIFRSTYLVVFLIGVGWAGMLKVRNPTAYRDIAVTTAKAVQ